MQSASASARMAGGRGTFDLTSKTGTKVEISGSRAPDGTEATLMVEVFGSTQPPGTKPVQGKSAAFYDVKVQGISDGSARVCITDPSVNQSAWMQYWKGNSWIQAGGKTVSANTICGDIPSADLNGTPIVVGT